MQTDWVKINSYYEQGLEQKRLSAATNLERLRTLDILDRFLGPAPQVIYDVGGGTGVYAGPMAEKGHEVHLIDPVDLHIQQARDYNQTLFHKIVSIEIGNALKLAFKDNSADVVLLFGPLYHLVEKDQRLKALSEAKRVLKPGGQLFAVGISRFAPLIDLFWNQGDYLEIPEVQKMVAQDLINGQHRCPEGTDCFTTAFLHHPDELRTEIIDAKLHDVRVLGIEGPIWKAPEWRKLPENAQCLNIRMSYLRMVEEEPTIIGASAHLMAIAKKPKKDL